MWLTTTCNNNKTTPRYPTHNTTPPAYLVLLHELGEHDYSGRLCLPYHAPEVGHSLLQRSLCHYEGIPLTIILQKCGQSRVTDYTWSKQVKDHQSHKTNTNDMPSKHATIIIIKTFDHLELLNHTNPVVNIFNIDFMATWEFYTGPSRQAVYHIHMDLHPHN